MPTKEEWENRVKSGMDEIMQDAVYPIPDFLDAEPEFAKYANEVVSHLIERGLSENDAWDKARETGGLIYVSYEDGDDAADVAFWISA